MDYPKIAKEARRQGWREETTKSGTKWLAPDGVTIVTWHGTPSDVRAVRNFLSHMRRAGFIWPPPKRKKGKQ